MSNIVGYVYYGCSVEGQDRDEVTLEGVSDASDSFGLGLHSQYAQDQNYLWWGQRILRLGEGDHIFNAPVLDAPTKEDVDGAWEALPQATKEALGKPQVRLMLALD